jgi:phosphopantothenoylcysteine decarboxylase / phosphopantothenate---cysteine ligase
MFQDRLKKVVVCCGGAIGVIDVPRLVLAIRRMYGSDVYVVMSEAATKFVTPHCMEICTSNPVLTDFAEFKVPGVVPHLWLGRGASICLVVPATANIIGKMAAAICDDPVSTCIQAMDCPVLVVPSMNESMWKKQVLQDKVEYLRRLGFKFVPPGEGLEIATMESSDASMPHIGDLVEEIIKAV